MSVHKSGQLGESACYHATELVQCDCISSISPTVKTLYSPATPAPIHTLGLTLAADRRQKGTSRVLLNMDGLMDFITNIYVFLRVAPSGSCLVFKQYFKTGSKRAKKQFSSWKLWFIFNTQYVKPEESLQNASAIETTPNVGLSFYTQRAASSYPSAAGDSWHCGNAWELCNWNSPGLFWACKMELMSWAAYVIHKPHVPSSPPPPARPLPSRPHPLVAVHWELCKGKNENETLPPCHARLFWRTVGLQWRYSASHIRPRSFIFYKVRRRIFTTIQHML